MPCTWLFEFRELTTDVTTLLFDDVLLLLWWGVEGVAVVSVEGMVVNDGVDGGGGLPPPFAKELDIPFSRGVEGRGSSNWNARSNALSEWWLKKWIVYCYYFFWESNYNFFMILYKKKEKGNAYLRTKTFVHQLYSHHVKTSFLKLAFHMDGLECPVALVDSLLMSTVKNVCFWRH